MNLRRLPDSWTAEDEELLQALDDATATPVEIVYRLSREWFDGVLGVIADLEDLIAARPSIALALLEHLAIRLDAAGEDVDDSGGGWSRRSRDSSRCTLRSGNAPARTR